MTSVRKNKMDWLVNVGIPKRLSNSISQKPGHPTDESVNSVYTTNIYLLLLLGLALLHLLRCILGLHHHPRTIVPHPRCPLRVIRRRHLERQRDAQGRHRHRGGRGRLTVHPEFSNHKEWEHTDVIPRTTQLKLDWLLPIILILERL